MTACLFGRESGCYFPLSSKQSQREQYVTCLELSIGFLSAGLVRALWLTPSERKWECPQPTQCERLWQETPPPQADKLVPEQNRQPGVHGPMHVKIDYGPVRSRCPIFSCDDPSSCWNRSDATSQHSSWIPFKHDSLSSPMRCSPISSDSFLKCSHHLQTWIMK